MRTNVALVKQHLVELRLTTLIWMATITLLSYMVVSMAPSVTADNFLIELIKTMPPGMAKLYGNLFVYKYPVDAFIQFKWMLFAPVLVMIFGVLAAMAAVAKELDRRTADFILTLPISRTRLLLARFAALTINMALLYIVSLAALWAGLRITDTPAFLTGYTYFYLGGFFITLAFAAYTLWLSVVIEEYSLAVRIPLVTGVTLWTLQITSRTLGGPLWFERLMLFGWVQTEDVIAYGRFPWGAVLVGTLLTALFLGLAIRAFRQKQITA